MSQGRAPSLPDHKRWIAFLKFMAVFYVFFFPFYFGAGHMATLGRETLGLYWEWERNIPIVPWMIWPYLTLFSLFLLPLFHMNVNQIAVLSRQSSATLVIAGICFLCFPSHPGFAPVVVDGWQQPVFHILAMVDTPYNLAPSLHVVFSALILLGCAEQAPTPWAWGYRFWLVLMSVSTVLVHQHHIVDVMSGLLLAWMARRLFKLASA